MNFNKAIIVGNLTRDPETRMIPSGQAVSSFSIATNRIWNDQSGNKQQATEYHNIVAFGKLADICSKYLSKGRLVLVEGRIQTRSWQDQSGVKKYRTEIVAENMQMGPKSDSAGSVSSASPRSTSVQQVQQEEIPVIDAEEPIIEKTESEPGEINVKDIPF